MPPLVFVAINAVWGVTPAAWAGLGLALAVLAWRLIGRKSTQYAFSGLIGTGLAVGLTLRSGEARAYFLPGIVSGAFTATMILVSILARRPFVAWSSWVTRQWPLDWYWHDRVRPAYTFTSWIWFGFFATRTSGQWWLYSTDRIEALGVMRAATGWPGFIGLLASTYVIGRRRLETLGGPSVDQFVSGSPPPWTPQDKGF